MPFKDTQKQLTGLLSLYTTFSAAHFIQIWPWDSNLSVAFFWVVKFGSLEISLSCSKLFWYLARSIISAACWSSKSKEFVLTTAVHCDPDLNQGCHYSRTEAFPPSYPRVLVSGPLLGWKTLKLVLWSKHTCNYMFCLASRWQLPSRSDHSQAGSADVIGNG